MAYGLRYYKEIAHADGSVFRLEIHKKDSTVSAVEIGAVVQGFSLEIQGQQGDVDTPIVKTSLSMTFVDAGDVEDGRKNGFWEEFYTPDALLWKVILKAKNATENTFRTMWGGYVTPDSFSEDLVYHGSVTIIARDNIGHMQDFPFDASGDADGLISLYNLVNSGWEKIESPMSLAWDGDCLYCEGVPAYDTLMNVSAFEDKNWYEAIESVLASYGLVMRYIGDNVVQISSLRYMPYQGKERMDLLPRIEPKFIAGAQRELVPAVRRIEESVSYEFVDDYAPLVQASDYSGDVVYVQMGAFTAPVWPLKNTARGYGWGNSVPSSAMYFNPAAYDVHEVPFLPELGSFEREIHDSMFLLCDSNTAVAEYSRYVSPNDCHIVLKLGQTINLYGNNDYDLGIVNGPTKVFRIKYAVSVEDNGLTYYLNNEGAYVSDFVELEAYDEGNDVREIQINVPLSDFGSVVILCLHITGIETQTAGLEETYIQMLGLSLGINDTKAYCQKNNVNTVYNAENNVILSRTPDFGPAFDRVTLPAFIKNGIFYRYGDAILPARAWAWSGGTPQQMAVYNHLQLLCYYAKPNNQISGTIVNADLTRARAIYEWHGKEHILVSGRYDFLTGFIVGAILREFIRYDDMWGEVSEALLPDTEENSRSNIEAGAGSGSSSSTYTNTTTVNIGSGGGGGASYLNDLLDVSTDDSVAGSVLYFTGESWIDKSFALIIEEYLANTKKLGDWFGKDEHGIYTHKNFRSTGTLSSGGAAQVGEGGGSGGVTGEYKMYVHTQGDPLKEWTITHNLNKVPNVKVIDSTGNQVYGDVKVENINIVTVSFGGAFSGIAYLD